MRPTDLRPQVVRLQRPLDLLFVPLDLLVAADVIGDLLKVLPHPLARFLSRGLLPTALPLSVGERRLPFVPIMGLTSGMHPQRSSDCTHNATFLARPLSTGDLP